MAGKLKVGIIFGGKSVEHEVSLKSARNVLAAIDKSKFEPVLIGIDREGKWHLNDASKFLLDAANPNLVKLSSSNENVAIVPTEEKALGKADLVSTASTSALGTIDVAFPILHGLYGEDGTVQGLLKLAQIPFVGPDVLGSAVGMDKDAMKRLLRDAGIPIAKFLCYPRHKMSEITFEGVKAALGMPCFIKPANTGSSVGISKAVDSASLEDALETAAEYDNKIIIEEFIKGRELECGVLGNENPVASIVGEIVTQGSHEFYSYEAKYLDADGARIEIPAKIPDETKKRVRELAVKSFEVLCCEGMARVDMFLKDDGSLCVNEINTIPGFTNISMYPKLFEASGIPYSDLITKLIELAIQRFERDQKVKVVR